MSIALIVGMIFLLAGVVQGLTGFGSALVAIPLLCLVIDIKTAVPLCMLNSLIITTTLILQLRKDVDRRKIMPLCLSAIPGILVGATVLKTVDAATMRFLLGTLLTIYAIYSLTVQPKPRQLHSVWSWVAGFSSGAIGAAFSVGGPPTIIYAALKNWNKDEIKATLTGFFMVNSYLIVAVHGLTGVITKQSLQLFLASALFVLAGTLGGSRLYRFLPDKNYVKLIYIFLIIMGVMMIFGA